MRVKFDLSFVSLEEKKGRRRRGRGDKRGKRFFTRRLLSLCFIDPHSFDHKPTITSNEGHNTHTMTHAWKP